MKLYQQWQHRYKYQRLLAKKEKKNGKKTTQIYVIINIPLKTRMRNESNP